MMKKMIYKGRGLMNTDERSVTKARNEIEGNKKKYIKYTRPWFQMKENEDLRFFRM